MKLRIAAALFTCVSLMMMSVALFAATASAQDGYSSGTIDPPPSRPPGQPATNPEDPDPTPVPATRPTTEPEAPAGPDAPPEPPDAPDSPDSPAEPPTNEVPTNEAPTNEAPQDESPAAPAAPPTMPRPDAAAPTAAPVAMPSVTSANGDTTGHLVTVESGGDADSATNDGGATNGPIGYGFDRPVEASTIVVGASDGFVGDPSAGSVSVTPSLSFDDQPAELAYTGPETPYIAYGGLALISAGMLALHFRRRIIGPAPKLEYR